MMTVTKIFHFEMAHALLNYDGACKNIHGHSYQLQVSVFAKEPGVEYIPAPGFLIDFKEIKKIVKENIAEKFDHKLVLSKDWLEKNPAMETQENLVILEAEPSAENLLFYFQKILFEKLPKDIQVAELKLYETKDSYATWKNNNLSHY